MTNVAENLIEVMYVQYRVAIGLSENLIVGANDIYPSSRYTEIGSQQDVSVGKDPWCQARVRSPEATWQKEGTNTLAPTHTCPYT